MVMDDTLIINWAFYGYCPIRRHCGSGEVRRSTMGQRWFVSRSQYMLGRSMSHRSYLSMSIKRMPTPRPLTTTSSRDGLTFNWYQTSDGRMVNIAVVDEEL